MNWILLFLLAIGIPTLIFVGIAADARNYVFNKRLRAVARQIDGTFIKGTFLTPPSIRFTVEGVPALVSFWVGPHRPEPIGNFRARRRGGDDEIVEVEDAHWGNRVFGPDRLQTGDEDFDARFRVYATSPAAGARVDASLRRVMEKLSVMGPARVAFRPTLVEVSVRAEDWDELTIRQFVELSIDAARPAIEAPAVEGDIRWIDEPEPDTLKCQVCASELGPAFVRCRRCRAPHHEPCWDYTDLCATFGCGGRKFTRQ